MDAPCKIQGSIHVFRLVNNMCPGKWVHINAVRAFKNYVPYRYFILLQYDYIINPLRLIIILRQGGIFYGKKTSRWALPSVQDDKR